MNKKGVTERTWHWMVSMIVITITTFTFVYTISLWQTEMIETPYRLEHRLIAYRALTNPDCLALHQNQRVHSGIIDTNKLEKNRVIACLPALTTNYRIDIRNETDTMFSVTRGQINQERATTLASFTVTSSGDLLRMETTIG